MREATEEAVKPEAWLKMICPICQSEFLHLEQYKPFTCQKKECIYKGRELKNNQ